MPDAITSRYNSDQIGEVMAYYKIKAQEREAERARDEQRKEIERQRAAGRTRMRRR